ncbi:MAG: AAA family ATPase [Nitrospirales bacterium]|nr:MAG: AAA family ATPase [Nitrospirales bacterium]
MYKEHFGFRELPFSITPDPRYLFLSEQHREALAHLLYGIKSDGGFVLLTGEVGTGKTTVCRCLLEQIPDKTDIAFILNPKMTSEELLAAVCDELRISYPEGNSSIKAFVDRINEYLLNAHARGRKTVLIIEEAQNLAPDVLEQIRLLTNLETNHRKLLQIVMVGQPELKAMLSRPDMLQRSQRITARYHIGPLSKGEVGRYVNHRWAVAGATRKVFPDSTFDRLYRLSKGIPRMINVICDRALLGAYVQGNVMVDDRTLVTAAREVLDHASWMKQPAMRVRWILTGILLIGFIATLWVIVNNHKTPIRGSVTVAANEEASGNEKRDTLRWPEGQTVDQSINRAVGALFRQWGVPYQPAKDVNACQQALARELRCLKGPGSLKDLSRLNKPAVLRFFDEKGRAYYGTLTAFDERTATVIIADETRRVGVDEIKKRWYGDYTLLWKHPQWYISAVKPGYRGPEVEWIDRQLSRIEGISPQPGKGVPYDGELVNRMKSFQIAEGLIPDGIVGPHTFIQIGNATGENGPVLMKKSEGR